MKMRDQIKSVIPTIHPTQAAMPNVWRTPSLSRNRQIEATNDSASAAKSRLFQTGQSNAIGPRRIV